MINITKNALLLSLCLCLGMGSGCSKNLVEADTEEPVTEEPVQPKTVLAGTRWKFAGYVDVLQKTVKNPESTGNENFLLAFNVDSTIGGKAFSRKFYGDYMVDYKEYGININVVAPENTDYYDGKLYIESLRTVHFFYLQDSMLTLFYNSNEVNTLLFFSEYGEAEFESDRTLLSTINFDLQDSFFYNQTMQYDSLYVINSNEELNRYISCKSDPQIDFSKKTLLIAYGATARGLTCIYTELSVINNTYSLNADIILNDATYPEGWRIALLTDKINTKEIILNIIKH